jgi:hypothetical protein
MKTKAELLIKLELKHGKSIKISRIIESLNKMTGGDLIDSYQDKSPEQIFKALEALYDASQGDGGKTKWRDRITYRNGKSTPYCKENFNFFMGSNRENPQRYAPINNFYNALMKIDNNPLTDYFIRKESTNLTAYSHKILSLELIIQDYINKHQRNNHDFSDDNTFMDTGLDQATNDARSILFSTTHNKMFSMDPLNISILKKIELNLNRNDLSTTIASALETGDTNWLDSGKFISSMRKFGSLDDLSYALESTFHKEVPENFYPIVIILVTGYVQKRYHSKLAPYINDFADTELIVQIAKEQDLINDESYFIMGFVIMSLYVKNTKISVTVYGDNNKERSIYYILNDFIENRLVKKLTSQLDFSFDVEDFIYDKFSQIYSTPLDYCIESGDEDILSKSVVSYAKYRSNKFIFIDEVYDRLSEHSLDYIDALMNDFESAYTDLCLSDKS